MSELTTQGKIRRALTDLGELTDLHPLSIDAIREAIESGGHLACVTVQVISQATEEEPQA